MRLFAVLDRIHQATLASVNDAKVALAFRRRGPDDQDHNGR